MIPVAMTNLKTISAFKREVKNWKLENCPCRLCKPYIQNVGFIQTPSIWLFIHLFILFFSLLNFKLFLVVPCSQQSIHRVNAPLVYDFIVWLTLISICLIYSYSFLVYFCGTLIFNCNIVNIK